MNHSRTPSALSAICFALFFPFMLMMGQSPGPATPHRSSYDDPPPFKFEPWWEFVHRDHPTFGARLAGLGDVNKDGGNDFAVSTCTDTTFIFFGGKALDDYPDAWVRGGGWKIVPGDFNGDGYVDLAVVPKRPFPGHYGRVMIYLNNKTPSVYYHDPDVTITGTDISGEFGNEIKAGDLNGDGFTDLVISAPGAEIRDSVGTKLSQGKIFMYLGKPVLDTIPDHVFYGLYEDHPSWQNTAIGAEGTLCLSDINGDGLEDLSFIFGEAKQSPTRNSLEIYYGNPSGIFGTRPDQEMNNDYYFYFIGRYVLTGKINGDNISDLAFPNDEIPNKDLSVVWGRSWGFYPPLPDGVFENPDPSFYEQGAWLKQVGDLNGDGYDDYFVGWTDRSHAGVIVEMYRGGKSWEHHAVAYYPILGGRDYYSPDPIPLHDIDGDGIDDFGLEKGSYCDLATGTQDRVLMYRGSRGIPAVTGVERVQPEPGFHLFPSPVQERLTLVFDRFEQSVNIEIYDGLGRMRKSLKGFTGKETTIDVQELPAGVYLAVMGRKGGLSTRKLIVLH